MTSNLSTFNRLVGECMVATGLSRADAERAVARRYPEFAPAPARSGVGGGVSAERELDQRARELAARDRISYAQAYVQVLNADSDLYLRYLQQKQSQVEAAARRG